MDTYKLDHSKNKTETTCNRLDNKTMTGLKYCRGPSASLQTKLNAFRPKDLKARTHNLINYEATQ